MDVERILNAVEHEFGTTINTKADCVSLEQHIHEVTKERISYNTLRRAFGLVQSKTKISTNSLNILARYIGYNDFLEFRKVPEKEKTLSKYQLQSEILKDDFHASYAKELILKVSADNVLHLAYLLKYLLRDQRFSQIAEIFSFPEWLRINIHNYGTSMALGNFVGRDFLNLLPNSWLPHFISKTYYPEVILSFFVPSLERGGKYQNQIEHLFRLARTSEQKIFTSSLLGLWAYLDGKSNTFKKHLATALELKGEKKLFPPLDARLTALQIFNLPKKQVRTNGNDLIDKALARHLEKRLFLFELITLLFITEQDELCKKLLLQAREIKWRSTKWTNIGADQIFKITEAYYALLAGNEASFWAQKRLINPSKWHHALAPNLKLLNQRLEKLQLEILSTRESIF